ncbi:PorV/PorQ family protein [Pontibacter sp. G13]|uniref:PorV/PorQ family protein n=1 Tax=Pontibacter sp. G13 TaxID=3074898 RepID=UPI002889BB39|nr:PorV/PorQ family protein [Pontibacter sp. G13]WNJ20156.1 PorV/PorQ family protein [Pontibacter sp. G13]
MKNIYPIIALMLAVCTNGLYAQSERNGQAGATQLLINSMPRSSAFNGLDIASVDGIESSMVNPGGMARTTGTELMFGHTIWLQGSGIAVNSFGISQSLGGESGTVGLLVNAFDLGEFVRTTEDNPDGTLGTFSPTYLNIGLTFARKFTDHIYVGTTVRVISESDPSVNATGVAFDAGIQYRTGERDRLKLGISLRNVGPKMQYAGDGLSFRVPVEPDNPYNSSSLLPAESFEIPATLSMGASLDFFVGSDHTVTTMGSFISNAFYQNQGGAGLAYQFKKILVLRGSFLYENGIFNDQLGDGRYNAHTGLAAGASLQVPFQDGKLDASGYPSYSKLSLDFSYRSTNPFGGTYVIGARIDI